MSKQEINYDLSDSGRAAWTPDASRPGSGNFCYGHRGVQSIASSTPNNSEPGAGAAVTYQYKFSGAPGWAQAAEVQNAFPRVASDLANTGLATATLTDTENGWQVTTPPPHKEYATKKPTDDGGVMQ